MSPNLIIQQITVIFLVVIIKKKENIDRSEATTVGLAKQTVYTEKHRIRIDWILLMAFCGKFA